MQVVQNAPLKFMVVSGFLGAGKTTTMTALAQYLEKSWGATSLIANDLGARNLVDAALARAVGVRVTEIAGDCICYVNDTLVDKLDRLHAAGDAFVISDIPGCGIGALDHVYLQLQERYSEAYDLAPFTVVVDPVRLRMITQAADLGLPMEECRFLLDAQLQEADCIVLNKKDLVGEAELAEDVAYLQHTYPDVPVFSISALTGEGVPELAEYLVNSKARLQRKDIGYGSDIFVRTEAQMCWFNRRSFFKTSDGGAVDFNQVIESIMNGVRDGLREAGRNVPHLKVFAEGQDGEFAKASLLGVGFDIEWTQRLASTYTKIGIVFNARAMCESDVMASIVDDAIDAVCRTFGLSEHCFFVECFGMMDEGRKAVDGGRASRIE